MSFWCYKGEFQHDMPHGQGRKKWKDGRLYMGQFDHGQMHGMIFFLITNFFHFLV